MKKSTSKKAKAKVVSKPKAAARKATPTAKPKDAKPAVAIASRTAQTRATDAAPSKKSATRPQSAAVSPSQPASLRNGQMKKVEPQAKARKNEPDKAQRKGAAPPPPPEPEAPPVKTYLNAKELKEFKTLLLDKRAELAGDVERLTSEALNRKSGGVNEQSTMPIHMADLGSDTWEQDFTLGLIANEQALVREIDDALARIEDRTYGMCVATDKPISKERLRAKPWAKYCIEYARLREEGRAP